MEPTRFEIANPKKNEPTFTVTGHEAHPYFRSFIPTGDKIRTAIIQKFLGIDPSHLKAQAQIKEGYDPETYNSFDLYKTTLCHGNEMVCISTAEMVFFDPRDRGFWQYMIELPQEKIKIVIADIGKIYIYCHYQDEKEKLESIVQLVLSS